MTSNWRSTHTCTCSLHVYTVHVSTVLDMHGHILCTCACDGLGTHCITMAMTTVLLFVCGTASVVYSNPIECAQQLG